MQWQILQTSLRRWQHNEKLWLPLQDFPKWIIWFLTRCSTLGLRLACTKLEDNYGKLFCKVLDKYVSRVLKILLCQYFTEVIRQYFKEDVLYMFVAVGVINQYLLSRLANVKCPKISKGEVSKTVVKCKCLLLFGLTLICCSVYFCVSPDPNCMCVSSIS